MTHPRFSGHENNLEAGLRKLAEGSELEIHSKYERLITIDKLLDDTQKKIERLAKAFGEERDEMIASALRQEMKSAKKVYDALQEERSIIKAQINQQQISEEDIDTIKQLATQIKAKLREPSFSMKRRLLDLLDVKVQLVLQSTGLYCVVDCKAILKQSRFLT